MIEKILLGAGLCVLGIFLIRTRRGAHEWYASSGRAGGPTLAPWFAGLFGPELCAWGQALLGLMTLLAAIAVIFSAD